MEDRYRVEHRIDSKNYFRKDCSEQDLEYTKKIIKAIHNKEVKGKCFYRKFPVSKSNKVYF